MEIQINKDVGSYEPKLIGPFTIRQSICLVIGAPISIGIYKYGAQFLPADAVSFLTFFPAVLVWLFGWTKPYGMPPERFLKSILVNMVLAPGNRIHQTDFLPDQSFAETEKAAEKKKAKYRRSPEGIE